MTCEGLFKYLNWHVKRNLADNIQSKWNEAELRKFVEKLDQLIRSTSIRDKSYFTFHANTTLTGEPEPCSNIECRIRNADKMSRFSALYADKVLYQSPFDKHLISNMPINRYFLLGDIFVLLYNKPLVTSGIIEYISDHMTVCYDCREALIKKEKDFYEKFKSVRYILNNECLNNIKCNLHISQDKTIISIDGAGKYDHHKNISIGVEKLPPIIEKLRNHHTNQIVPLSKAEIKELDIPNLLLSRTYEDLSLHKILCSKYGFSYITDSNIDIQAINLMQTDDILEVSNNLFNSLSHTIPYLTEASIENIVTLRMKEAESFNVYRDNLNKILSGKTILSENECKDIQRDIIQPSINSIKFDINKNKKLLLGSIKKDVAFWTTTLSIGLFGGFIEPNTTALLGALGGLKTIKESLDCILDYGIGNGDSIARNNEFYFLWRLTNQKRK